jgi:hypothetical protein
MLERDINELRTVQAGIDNGLAHVGGDALGEAMGTNATLVGSLKQQFGDLKTSMDARLASGLEQITVHVDKQQNTVAAMKNKLQVEEKDIDQLIGELEKCLEATDGECDGKVFMRKQISSAEIFLTEPSSGDASFRAGSCDVVKWDNSNASAVLRSFLENENTWDEAKRAQFQRELSVCRMKMAEAKEAIDILLEVEDYTEAAIYQAEHDKYLLLAADCQRQLILWYDQD